MSNNNNNSDKTYLIVGIVCFLCYISSGAGLLIRYITKSDTSKKSQSPSSSPASTPASTPVSSPSSSSAAQKQDCVFEWEYGTKDESEGKQLKTYKLITKSSGGGISCQYDDGDQVIEDVKVNCGGDWNGFSDCSKSCGSGTKTRTWKADPAPKNGGTACPSPETVSCNLESCKTCQSNGSYENYYSMYGFRGTYDGCTGITNQTDCTNKLVDIHGYGYPSNVCKWK